MPRLHQAFFFSPVVVAFLSVNLSSVYAQGNLSPHLNANSFGMVSGKTVLSISVKDTSEFRKKYAGKTRIQLIHPSTQTLSVTLGDTDVLQTLRSDPNVLFVDTQRQPHVEGDFDLVNPSINKINQAHHSFPGLRGAGYNLSIKEEHFNEDDIDLKGRGFRTTVTPSAVSQHATIMAVLIGGAGNSSSLTYGVASRVRLTSSDFNNLMPDDIALFTGNNILTQNHSYGVGIENYYGNEAIAYDQQVADNPHLVHVFSSGNIGTTRPTTGTYKDLSAANLTGTFKQSKNVIVVSAIDTSLQVNPLNSRGPAYDGRLKPELTAYGPGGTSEAAALTTGSVTLIQEKYKSMNSQLPDMSLVKAILIASADDIGAKGVDFISGYGNLNAHQALHLVDQNQLFSATLSQQDQARFSITVNAGISQLKVAICWTDPPATVNSGRALVNDIDSWLDNGTAVYHPWVLSTFPNPDSLTAGAIRKPDHINNVEFITLDHPTPGTYQLVLKSGMLMGTAQKVSVAYSLVPTVGFSWTYPVASDIVPSGRKNLLVWDAQATGPGDLYLQLNSGGWQPLGRSLDLQTPFHWNAPDTLASAMLKMTINGIDFFSDAFVLSPKPQLKMLFNCSDSVGLYWKRVSSATGYDVFVLGDQYLEHVRTTEDTIAIFHKPIAAYFAVAPRLDQANGIKSGAINYSNQGTACYINFFSADRIKPKEVQIQLSLSSIYKISHINLLKTVNGTESLLQSIFPHELNYSISDFLSEGGVHTYQAQIVFTDASTLLSDPWELIIESPGSAILWPNPVTQNDYLHVISEGNVTLRIVSQLGETILEKKLTLLQEELDIEPLAAGLYFYQLMNDKTMVDAGRIIKL